MIIKQKKEKYTSSDNVLVILNNSYQSVFDNSDGNQRDTSSVTLLTVWLIKAYILTALLYKIFLYIHKIKKQCYNFLLFFMIFCWEHTKEQQLNLAMKLNRLKAEKKTILKKLFWQWSDDLLWNRCKWRCFWRRTTRGFFNNTH